jgi:hypothetical protein
MREREGENATVTGGLKRAPQRQKGGEVWYDNCEERGAQAGGTRRVSMLVRWHDHIPSVATGGHVVACGRRGNED